MRAKFVLVAVLLLTGLPASLTAQSLADVARREQERRKDIKQPAKVLTNKDLSSVPAPPPAAASTGASDATAPPPAEGVKDTKPDAENKAAEPAKDQAYWSGRAKGLQTQLERDQTFAVAMQSRINALAAQYTNQGDPVQQAILASDKQKSIDELNRLTKQIDDDKKAIATLQEDARRAGVPSGWLR